MLMRWRCRRRIGADAESAIPVDARVVQRRDHPASRSSRYKRGLWTLRPSATSVGDRQARTQLAERVPKPLSCMSPAERHHRLEAPGPEGFCPRTRIGPSDEISRQGEAERGLSRHLTLRRPRASRPCRTARLTPSTALNMPDRGAQQARLNREPYLQIMADITHLLVGAAAAPDRVFGSAASPKVARIRMFSARKNLLEPDPCSTILPFVHHSQRLRRCGGRFRDRG